MVFVYSIMVLLNLICLLQQHLSKKMWLFSESLKEQLGLSTSPTTSFKDFFPFILQNMLLFDMTGEHYTLKTEARLSRGA